METIQYASFALIFVLIVINGMSFIMTYESDKIKPLPFDNF